MVPIESFNERTEIIRKMVEEFRTMGYTDMIIVHKFFYSSDDSYLYKERQATEWLEKFLNGYNKKK